MYNKLNHCKIKRRSLLRQLSIYHFKALYKSNLPLECFNNFDRVYKVEYKDHDYTVHDALVDPHRKSTPSPSSRNLYKFEDSTK